LTVDLSVLLILVLAAAAGALAGALRQVFLALGAVAGWAAVRFGAGPAGQLLERTLSPPLARAVAVPVLFVLAFSSVALVGRMLRRRATGVGGALDRALGALLGGGQAALVSWLALAALDLAGARLPRTLQAQLARSDLAALVREHDALGPWRRPAEQALSTLLSLAQDPRAAPRLAADPELGALLGDRRVQEIVSGRLPGRPGVEPLRTPEALQLLADPEFRERLEQAQGRLDRERARR
jgi:hypothetical protein